MNSIKNFSVKGFSGKLALLQISLSALFFSMFLSGCPNLQASGKSVVAVNLPAGGGQTQNSRKALPNPENRKTDDIYLWTVNLVRAEEHSLYQTQNGKSGKTVEFEIDDEIPLTIEVFALSENGEVYASGKSEKFTTKLGHTTEVPVNVKWNYLSVKPDSEDLISISEAADRNFYFSVRAECAEDETDQFSFEWFSSKTESSGTDVLPSDAESEGNGESEYIKPGQNSYDYYRNVFRGNFGSSSDTQVYYCLATRKYPYFNSPESKKILGPFVVTSASLQSISAEYKTKSGSDYDILCGHEIHLSDFRITEKFSDGKERQVQNPSGDYFSLDFSTSENDSEKGNTVYKIGNVPAKIQSSSNPQISAETKIRVAYDFSGKFDSFGGTKAETKLAAGIYEFDGVHTKIGEEIKADNEKFIFYGSDYGTSSALYSEISLNYAYTWTSSEEYVIRESKVNQISLDMADLNLTNNSSQTKNTNLTQTAKISLVSNESEQTSPQELSPEKQAEAKKYLLNLPESIETLYPILIYSWNVSIKDGNGTKADEKNLSAGTTYTVSAENAAYTSETFEEIKKYISLSESSSSSAAGSGFTENGMTFTTPSAKTSTQGTEIRVKFTNDVTGTEGSVLARLNVQVPADTSRTLTKIEATYNGTGYILGSGQSGNRLTELPETLPPSDFTVTEYYKDVEENETSAQVNDLSDYTFRWQTNVNRSLSIGQVPVLITKNNSGLNCESTVSVKYTIDAYEIDTTDKNLSAEQKTDGTTYPLGDEIPAKTWQVWNSSQSQEKSDSFTYKWQDVSDQDISGETNAIFNAPLSSSGMVYYTRAHYLQSCDKQYYDSTGESEKNKIIYWLDVTAASLNENAADWDSLKAAIEKIASGSGTVTLTGTDYTATTTKSGEGTITVSGDVTIVTSSAATISRGNGNYYFTVPLFTVASGATLKLQADSTNTLVLDGGFSSRPSTSNQTLSLIECKGNLEITENITLKNNQNDSGDGYGGAIYVHKDTSSSVVPSLKFNGNIENCTASDGGAIYASDSTNQISVTLNGASISNNTANGTRSGCGGGIYLNNAKANFTNVTFTGNKADSDSSNSLGGAIFGKGTNLNLAITNCNFSGNYSNKGVKPDSLYFENGTVTKDSNDISNNNGSVLSYEETN